MEICYYLLAYMQYFCNKYKGGKVHEERAVKSGFVLHDDWIAGAELVHSGDGRGSCDRDSG